MPIRLEVNVFQPGIVEFLEFEMSPDMPMFEHIDSMQLKTASSESRLGTVDVSVGSISSI
jgi:hypothetical protein